MPRLPAEWAPHNAVWIGFPSDPELWLDDLAGAQSEVAAFARAVHAEGRGETVRLVCADGGTATQARAMASECAEIVELPFYDIWLRDIGPIVRGDGVALDYRGNGWGGKYPSPLDDAVGALLCTDMGLRREPRDWILEGGAIDADGAGLVVTTEQCLLNPNRNPGLSKDEIEARLKADLGVERVLWLGQGLAGDHTDGHVDNLARFVAPGLLALPEPAGSDDPNADAYADACARARAFGIETVAMPSPGRIERDGDIIAASYMNFYIGNAVVVVPIHGASNDVAAVRAVQALFPSRVATGLPTADILTGGGSFHCISQQVPA